MAELLATKQESPSGCLQPFRFVALDDENHSNCTKRWSLFLTEHLLVPTRQSVLRRNGAKLIEEIEGNQPQRLDSLRSWRQTPDSIGDSAMKNLLSIISSDEGQDIAEYAVMLAVILVLVVGTIRLVGSNANNVFSQVGSSFNN